jgi:chorismate--pyruvate lyase
MDAHGDEMYSSSTVKNGNKSLAPSPAVFLPSIPPTQSRLPSHSRSPAPPNDDIKRRSRWSTLWDGDVELETTENLWLSDTTLNSMLTPAWGQFLLSDGSMTRHLKLLTGYNNVKTDILWQGKINVNDANAKSIPSDVRLKICDGAKECVIFQREVDLCDASGVPLCYAASWWNEEMADMFIMDSSGAALNKPVWLALADTKTELYREIRRVYLGSSAILTRKWGVEGPFWARHYIFWRDGKPLCVIYEVLNPALAQYLGPSTPTAAPRRRARGEQTF